MANTKGRPKGSANVTTTIDVEPSRCPSCRSTKRQEYTNRNVQEYAGTYNGQPFDRIIRRRTRCAECNQARIDRTFEAGPPEPSPKK